MTLICWFFVTITWIKVLNFFFNFLTLAYIIKDSLRMMYKYVHRNRYSSSSSVGTATLVGFGLLNYRWVFSAGRFLQSSVASSTSNPQLGGPVISSNSRHKVSPAPKTTRANPSSGRWNYGREIAENCAESGEFHVTFGFFYMPQIYDMGPTALLPLRRKARWGIFRPKTWVPEASTPTSRPPLPLKKTYC